MLAWTTVDSDHTLGLVAPESTVCMRCVCVCVFYSYVIRLIVPNVHTNKTSYETLFEYWVWSNLWEGGEVRDRLSLKLDLREDVIDLYIFCLYLSLSVCVCVVTYCN